MQLLDHVSIAVADLDAARGFYDAVLAALGCERIYARADALGYGERCRAGTPQHSYLAVVRSAHPAADDRRHWCFKAATRRAVDAFHAAALAHGGRCDGPPGVRPLYHSSYYAAFVRDPDGNRIEAVCHRPEASARGASRSDRLAADDLASIRALAFDVFGTVVDWRSSIIREGEQFGQARGLQVDWAQFADAWRAGYKPAMDRVRKGDLPWTSIDGLHRRILDGLLQEFAIAGLSEPEIDHLNRVWHRLRPWPDAVAGLQQLRGRFTLATLSNGNVALLVNMARHAGLPWDCVLSAELFGHYKPDSEAYLGAVRLLGLVPTELMMVAAHPGDLVAASRAGLRTAYVPRPLEYGPGTTGEPVGDAVFDVVADDFIDLAQRLRA